MKKIPILLLAIVTIILGITAKLGAQTLMVSSDFNDGNIAPFHECTTKDPNYTKVVDGRVKTFWTSEGYDGTRADKGAEMCIATKLFHTKKEGWYGFTMNVGPDYRKDSNAGVAQIFGFSMTRWTWEAMLKITNNDLIMGYRGKGSESPGGVGEGNETNVTVLKDVPRNTDINIIIHFILSAANKGVMEVWINGEQKMNDTGIMLGFGTWNSDTDEVDCEKCRTELKAGQYNYDDRHYRENETRTVYYDNVTMYNGTDGYDIVDPSKMKER
jgi:hypothetical protein